MSEKPPGALSVPRNKSNRRKTSTRHAKTEDFFFNSAGGELHGVRESFFHSLSSLVLITRSSIAILDVDVWVACAKNATLVTPRLLCHTTLWNSDAGDIHSGITVFTGTRSRTTTDNNEFFMGTRVSRTTYYSSRDLFLFGIRDRESSTIVISRT